MGDKEVRAFFTNTISQDLLDVCIGDVLADGSTRTVYRCVWNPQQVVKFETVSKRFQNILEWETWEIVKHTKYKKWFAPCSTISSCGTILIQAFCRDLEDKELLEEIPAFFADVKRENFGMFDGQVVCRDYGNTFLIDRGFGNKMKKAEW